MKPRRYADDWPTPEEAEAITQQRRAEWEASSRWLSWAAILAVVAAFALPFLRS